MSNRPNPLNSLSYLSQFFIIVGMVMVSAFLFSVLAIFIIHSLYGIDAESLMQVLTNETQTDTEITALKIFQTIAAIGTFLVPAILAPIFFKENSREYLRINNTKPNLWILSLLLIIVIIPFNSFLIGISQDLAEAISSVSLDELQKQQEKTMEILLNMKTFPQYLFNLILIAVIPAVSEEFLFRGVGISLFKRWTGNHHIAIIIQGILFGAMHRQIENIIPLTVLGIVLGYVVWHTGSIWCGVLIHFINNGLAVTGYYLNKEGSVWEQLLADDFPVYLSIISLILSAGIFFLIWKYRIKEEQITIEIE